MKTIQVVAAVIFHEGKMYATQRGYGDWRDYWEFPGGKIEPGETPEEALVREIREELDVGITVLGHLCDVEYDYPEFHLSRRKRWSGRSGRNWTSGSRCWGTCATWNTIIRSSISPCSASGAGSTGANRNCWSMRPRGGSAGKSWAAWDGCRRTFRSCRRLKRTGRRENAPAETIRM